MIHIEAVFVDQLGLLFLFKLKEKGERWSFSELRLDFDLTIELADNLLANEQA